MVTDRCDWNRCQRRTTACLLEELRRARSKNCKAVVHAGSATGGSRFTEIRIRSKQSPQPKAAGEPRRVFCLPPCGNTTRSWLIQTPRRCSRTVVSALFWLPENLPVTGTSSLPIGFWPFCPSAGTGIDAPNRASERRLQRGDLIDKVWKAVSTIQTDRSGDARRGAGALQRAESRQPRIRIPCHTPAQGSLL